MSRLKSALRYYGGKAALAPRIIAELPEHRVYVEPFGGGASVLLAKTPAPYREVFNDLDGEVVDFFRVLRDPLLAAELERLLRLTPYARAEFLAAYESVEGTGPDARLERARRLVVRSFQGYGSGGVFSKTGFRSGNRRTSVDSTRSWAAYPDRLAALSARLQGVCIEEMDASALIRREDGPETLFYVDPPYVHETRNGGAPGGAVGNPYCRKGYRHELSDADHERLASVLRECEGMVALSGYRSALYDRLFHAWPRLELSAFADGASARTEVLWFNPAAWARRGVFFNWLGGAA